MSKLIESMQDVCLNKQKVINTPVRLSVEENVRCEPFARGVRLVDRGA